MAHLSDKTFPDDVFFLMKLAALHQKMTLKEYVIKTLRDSLPAAIYPENATEIPATGRKRPDKRIKID